MESKYNKHYSVGMEANGSRIVGIRYPEDSKPKWQGHTTRNAKIKRLAQRR